MSTETGDSQPSESSETSGNYWNAVSEIVTGLKTQPLLLFGFGSIFVVIAAGSIALEKLRPVLIAVLAIYALTLIAWVLTQANRLSGASGRQSPAGTAVKSGDVSIHGGTQRGVRIQTGDAKVSSSESSASVASGDVRLKSAKVEDSSINTGNVEEKRS